MGPLVSEEQHERVLNFIKSGLKEGATLACGSDKAARPQGYFVAPTVFTNVTDDMTIAREEIFGPVGYVMCERECIYISHLTDFECVLGCVPFEV